MKNKNENFLEKIPVLNQNIGWSKNEEGAVTLEIENKGAFNRIAQKLFKKPKISYIHLEEIGSFVWPLIDGEKDIFSIGEYIKEHFGEKAEPLYPRLVQYFETLETYKFIAFK